jgi:hypothetical protein
MSLRKSPQLTPALLAATQKNAQHSTGPRSPAAKQNSKLNALKHRGFVADENHRQAMLALGEDPEQLQTLTEELMSALGPGEAGCGRVLGGLDLSARSLDKRLFLCFIVNGTSQLGRLELSLGLKMH